jgi:flagellar basal-body rod protein FlgB
MLNKLSDALNFQSQALQLRGLRQEVLTSNVANADTPGFKAVDFDFAKVLRKASSGSSQLQPSSGSRSSLTQTDQRHLPARLSSNSTEMELKFRRAVMPSVDGNTVDIETERAQFAENALKYEAALRAVGGQLKTLQTAMSSNNS